MSAYKQFLSSDVISTPFVVNKGFTFTDAELTILNSGFYRIAISGGGPASQDTTAGLIQDGDKLVLTASNGTIIDPLITFRTTPTPNSTESALRSTASDITDWFDNYIVPAIRLNPFISNSNFSVNRQGDPAFLIRFTISSNPLVSVASPFAVRYSGAVSPSAFTFDTRSTSTSSVATPGGFASIGIDRLLGKNITGSLVDLGPTTGQIGTQYQSLVYNSAKHLYYSNFLTSSYGDSINLPYIIPGENENGNISIGAVHNPNFENYPQTSLTFPKIFPTGSDDIIGVISIPKKLFGEQILPESFRLTSGSVTLYDDGEGNIFDPQGDLVGNIIYSHGLVIISVDSGSIGSTSLGSTSIYGGALYDDDDVYGDDDGTSVLNFITDPNVTCSFSSSLTLFETQYKCTIGENEFNLSLNPSLSQIIDSDTVVYDYTTGSFFAPYITTVGLYNEDQELLAVGKLAQPVPTSTLTDMHIIINLDM